PPTSTLFPYTTLFRSIAGVLEDLAHRLLAEDGAVGVGDAVMVDLEVARLVGEDRAGVDRAGLQPDRHRQDLEGRAGLVERGDRRVVEDAQVELLEVIGVERRAAGER